MNSRAETITSYKTKVMRALMAGVLTFFIAVMPAIAQSPQSDFEVGKSYHDGDGVPQNYDIARSLYERAADNGNIDAMINLGYIYYAGEGVEQNYDKARDWYIRAERLGSNTAKGNLEGLYSRGLSSPPTTSETSAPEITSQPEIISQNVVSEDTELEEVTEKPKVKTPEPEPEIKAATELDTPIIPSTLPAIDTDEASTPPPEMQSPEVQNVSKAPKSRIDETKPPKLEMHDTLAEPQSSTPPSLKKPPFDIAKIIPYLIGLGTILCLVGIIGLVRFVTGKQRRFVESFMLAHDYGLRRMYSNFLQTPRKAINREIWLRGVSDMIIRHAHDEAIATAHTKQVRPIHEAAQDSQQAARIASASHALRAEKLIVKSYKNLGAPD